MTIRKMGHVGSLSSVRFHGIPLAITSKENKANVQKLNYINVQSVYEMYVSHHCFID